RGALRAALLNHRREVLRAALLNHRSALPREQPRVLLLDVGVGLAGVAEGRVDVRETLLDAQLGRAPVGDDRLERGRGRAGPRGLEVGELALEAAHFGLDAGDRAAHGGRGTEDGFAVYLVSGHGRDGSGAAVG